MMNPQKTLIATTLSLLAGFAQAQATFGYGASVEGDVVAPVYRSGPAGPGVFSTNGEVLASSGGVRAAVQAIANPTVGSFKSVTSSSVANVASGSFAEAYARMDLLDTLRFSGPGPTTQVRFTLSWDTTVLGVNSVRSPATIGAQGSFLQTWSFSQLMVSYQEANPDYDPTCTSEGEVRCAPQFLEISSQGGHNVFTQANGLAGGGIQLIGLGFGPADGDGHFTGQLDVSLIVPTDTDIKIDYTAYNTSRCFDVAACALSTDAMHSDYLGLYLGPGVTFTSAQNFQYLGQPSAVPEPASALLTLVGMAAVGLRVRRRGAAAAAA